MAEQESQMRCPKCDCAITPGDPDVDAVEVDKGVFVWQHRDDCTGEQAAEQERKKFEDLTGRDLPDD
jgi:hypothetical protein